MNHFMTGIKRCLIFILLLTMMSCTNYGKKVTFDGTKGEVYYKGDGVTEADANSLGKFLKTQNFFLPDDKKRSVQLSKKDSRIQVRFVIDEKGMAELKDPDVLFEILGASMSKDVFNNTPVDIIYTDDAFKDKKTIAYNPKVLEEQESDLSKELKKMKRKDDHNNTLYYSDNISEEEGETIFEYLKKNDFFTDAGTVDLIVNKTDNNGVHIRFPVQNSFANDEGYKKIDAFAAQLKKDLFGNFPVEFEVIDEKMEHLKTFTY